MIKLIVFTFSLNAFAAAPKPLHAFIQYGEKRTEISVTGKGKDYSISVDGGEAKSLNAKDFKTIAKAFAALPSTAQLPQECDRAYMRVEMNSVTKQSCFGMASINTPEFVKFSNLLLLAR